MVYRGSLQTDDARNVPRLVRITPLRSSRSNSMRTESSASIPTYSETSRSCVNPSTTMSSIKSAKSRYTASGVNSIDVDRAKLIEERRLCRERDIESVEKVILRTTGIKVGTPRLRNINDIRQTVKINTASIKHDNRASLKIPSSFRPRASVSASPMEESNLNDEGTKSRNSVYASTRTPSSLLADLKDLESLRNIPQAKRNFRPTETRANRDVDNESKFSGISTASTVAKTASPNAAKVRVDIMKIQQMFNPSSDRGSRAAAVNSTRNGRSIEGINSRASEKPERHGGEIKMTRLRGHKFIEASRGSCGHDDNSNASYGTKVDRRSKDKSSTVSKGLENNLPISSRLAGQQIESERQRRNDDTPQIKERDRPQAPVRKRKDSKISFNSDSNKSERVKKNSSFLQTSFGNKSMNFEIDSTKNKDAEFKNKTVLERPDILDGLLKESDRQLEQLHSDFSSRERPRSHWRGFVQSMRLHDVELHSDSEDSKKGQFTANVFSFSYLPIYTYEKSGLYRHSFYDNENLYTNKKTVYKETKY